MIYLDNCATSFVYDEVLQKMNYIYKNCNFNPSAPYDIAIKSENEIKNARAIIAESINANSDEIYFTSGASEGNNAAILGIARANKNKGKHIISSALEHSSVYNTLNYLKEYEGFEISFVKNDGYGVVLLDDLKNMIRKDTILVSISHINNELGSMNDISTIGKIIKSCNHMTYFHTDAVQSYMKVAIDVRESNIDLLSTSGHKLHCPKGIGFLYIKKNTKILPLIFGGTQENNFRAGTENVAAISALGLSVQMQSDFSKMQNIRKNKDYLLNQMINKIDDIRINTSLESNAPHILNISIAGIKTEVLLHYLEADDIYISTGSACSSKKKTSRVLENIKIEDKFKYCAIRLSLSEDTSKEDIDIVVDKIADYVKQIRKLTKYKKK